MLIRLIGLSASLLAALSAHAQTASTVRTPQERPPEVNPAQVHLPRAAAGIVPVPVQSVTIGGEFWTPRLAAIRTATLEANRSRCQSTGRLDNFDRAAAAIRGEPSPGAFQGLLFNDSDVYKMMQGWAVLISTEPDPARRGELDAELDELIARVAAAQHPDGYIDTYYTLKAGIEKRFTREEWDHETYCMGHLIEAAAVHFQATGKRNFLAVAIKAADFLRDLYGPEKFTAPPGHQQLELALVLLARVTGEPKYVDFAQELVEYRGKPHRKLDGTTYGPWGDYAQDHKPATDQFEAAGHAVRAGYLYAAMTDLALLGHRQYVPALDSLWEDITQRRIFVTGGIGPSGHNEGFTVPYDIPTQSAYQETCASIALCLWAHRMFLLHGDARYMEQFERTLFNAALAGVSLDGSKFFYVNPLASSGGRTRKDWFDCACCPPNVLRFFAALGQYVYAVRENTAYINLFIDSKARLIIGRSPVDVSVTTDYPWGDGTITVRAVNPGDADAVLAIRAPTDADPGQVGPDGYIRIPLRAGATVERTLSSPMSPRRVYSDPRVKATLGHAAIMRGPLVYAAESIDNPEVDLATVVLPVDAPITVTRDSQGVPELIADALIADAEAGPVALYTPAPRLTPVKLRLRPYFMWSNRGDASMRVWWPESPQSLRRTPHPGVLATASHAYSGESPDALLDGILPDPARGSADESITRLTFWPHKGTTEWVQYSFDRPRTVSSAAVYWFDDTGRGGCRLPASASLEYKSGDAWTPVPAPNGGAIGVERDAMNSLRFTPVTTSAVRLRMTLQPGFSAGVLEWSVQP